MYHFAPIVLHNVQMRELTEQIYLLQKVKQQNEPPLIRWYKKFERSAQGNSHLIKLPEALF